MEKAFLRHLFRKLADGTISRAEYSQLMDHIARHEVDSDDIPEDLQGDESDLPNASVGQAWDIVQRRTGIGQRPKKRALWLPLAAAAVIAGLLVGGVFGWWPTLTGAGLVGMADVDVAYVTKEVLRGQLDSVQLPDGSKMWVNAGSVVSYPANFAEGPRIVRLDGEAFFDVVHIGNRPFIVESGGIETTVVGTAFNINTYNADRVVVTVLRGKVRVDKERESLAYLSRNQQAVHWLSDAHTELKEVNAEDEAAWVEDRLVFRDVPVAQALDVLSRRFDTSFRLGDPAVGNCVFSASFQPGESLDKVLRVITMANGMTYRKEKNTFYLQGAGCP
ncbi:FecR family protein [Parapedobacter soli]|uniref:FecR family protein n=1 Tax=Parapedobacter soli TaxID=416955 RepID=UPI0021CA3D15|nr:FecR domain-containing protein [Parapedobacter soli]